jgi:predicted nuclease with RNAse H fold
MLVGIDYGSKTAGTTVICYGYHPDRLNLVGTSVKQDADQFLQLMLLNIKPELVCIDAPLSLPGIYHNLPGCTDYFYRHADKALNAMSPMFLGGLTARAIKLKNEPSLNGIKFLEAYPGGFVREFKLQDSYNKKEKALTPQFIEILKHKFDVNLPAFEIPNWHYADALICWLIAYRIKNKTNQSFGQLHEGLIYI